MEGAMPFEEDSSEQYGLAGHPVGESPNVPGNGSGPKSEMRILRLVVTPTLGCELLRKLRSNPLANDTPIVILAGNV